MKQFHSEEKIEQAKQQRKPEQIAFIPEEADALAGLGEVNRELVRELGRRCPEQRIATVDQDATAISGRRCGAMKAERGYQPMLAVWAEMDVVLADEFRDGNVPAMMAPLAVAKRAFAALPETVTSFYYRGDSASHEKELLAWLREEDRADGSQGTIGFAISARMRGALHQTILQIPETVAVGAVSAAGGYAAVAADCGAAVCWPNIVRAATGIATIALTKPRRRMGTD